MVATEESRYFSGEQKLKFHDDPTFISQATENIIKNLEKLDADPEPEEMMQDDTSDFTLFDVS